MNNVVKNSKTSSKKSITAKQLAKSNLTKRKNPDWDNLDRGYRYLTLDMKLPHDQAIAVMGNVVEESLGNYKAVLKNGNGKGLIQWDGREVPNGRYGLWGSIWASVAKPANVYDATTDTMKNYWAPWRGLKGDKVRLEFIKAPLKQKTLIYAESYLRPGKPRIADRQLSAMQLDSIYNPRIKNIIVQRQGGKMNILEFLKNGSGIHIKKKNRGKFTSYCGGKVTDECIRKAKASGNPTLVKRATFAANARKWKHKKGGILLFLLQGNKIDWAGMIGNLASQALLTYALNKLILAKADLLKEANNALKLSPMEYVSKYFLEIMDEENRRNEAIKAISGTTVNSSDVVGKFFAHQRGKLEAFAHNKEIDNLNKMIDAEAKELKSQGWMNFGTNLMLTGMGIAGLYLSNKGTTNAAPSTTPTTTGSSSTTGNSIYKLDSFWEKPYLTKSFNSTSIM